MSMLAAEKLLILAFFLKESPSKLHTESPQFLKIPLEICGTLFKETHLIEIIRYTRKVNSFLST